MSGNNLREKILEIIKTFDDEYAVDSILGAVAEALPEPSKGVSVLNDLNKEIEYEMEDWNEGYNAYRTEVLKILEGK